MNPFQELALLIKLRKPLEKLKGLLFMSLNWSRFLQILTVLAQIGNILLPMTSGNTKAGVAAGLGCITVILHQFAGVVNPDGTPAVVAYEPKK